MKMAKWAHNECENDERSRPIGNLWKIKPTK